MFLLKRENQSFILMFVLMMYLNPASAIQCFQCESTDHDNPYQCNEFMSEDSELQPTSCDYVDNANYCIKLVGRNRGVYSTSRHCSSVDLGNYCDYVKLQGDVMDYRSCVFTCDTDGCNAADGLTRPNCSLMLMSFLALCAAFAKNVPSIKTGQEVKSLLVHADTEYAYLLSTLPSLLNKGMEALNFSSVYSVLNALLLIAS